MNCNCEMPQYVDNRLKNDWFITLKDSKKQFHISFINIIAVYHEVEINKYYEMTTNKSIPLNDCTLEDFRYKPGVIKEEQKGILYFVTSAGTFECKMMNYAEFEKLSLLFKEGNFNKGLLRSISCEYVVFKPN